MPDPILPPLEALQPLLQPPPPPYPSDAKRARDRAMIMMAFVVVIAFFLYVTAVTFWKPVAVDKDILFLVLGNLSAQFTQVVSFFFGSSASSATKDEKLVEK
jgi:hypothetical protein